MIFDTEYEFYFDCWLDCSLTRAINECYGTNYAYAHFDEEFEEQLLDKHYPFIYINKKIYFEIPAGMYLPQAFTLLGVKSCL